MHGLQRHREDKLEERACTVKGQVGGGVMLGVALMALFMCIIVIFTVMNFYYQPTIQNFLEVLVAIALFAIYQVIRGQL